MPTCCGSRATHCDTSSEWGRSLCELNSGIEWESQMLQAKRNGLFSRRSGENRQNLISGSTFTRTPLLFSFPFPRSSFHLFFRSTGQTCVHLAASSGNRKLLDYLKDLGANFNLRVRTSATTFSPENSFLLSSDDRKEQRDGRHCMLLYLT